MAPAIVAAGSKVFDMVSSNTELRDKLEENTISYYNEINKSDHAYSKLEYAVIMNNYEYCY